jgi:3-deoxy-D-manno-octulosonate 8-phosphate phosphatase (KDO 8-P phosphatase)
LTSIPDIEQVASLVRDLKMLFLDVDGVLTDGGIILIGQEGEAKRFDVQDGMGINLAKAAGLVVAIITSRDSVVVQRRAKELGIAEVYQGAGRKAEALDQLLQKHRVEASQAAFIGDDIQDLPVMRKVGVPIAVQNAVAAVKECSVYITHACGGHGAVREAVEWLLEIRGDKDQVYQQITG